jgi:hypothetical protein
MDAGPIPNALDYQRLIPGCGSSLLNQFQSAFLLLSRPIL